jgi:hypothetical protein
MVVVALKFFLIACILTQEIGVLFNIHTRWGLMDYTNVIGPLPGIGGSHSRKATMMSSISKMLKKTILGPTVPASLRRCECLLCGWGLGRSWVSIATWHI